MGEENEEKIEKIKEKEENLRKCSYLAYPGIGASAWLCHYISHSTLKNNN